MPEVKIKCPKCQWEPDNRPYWECHCGYVWNTFETAGRCPCCNFQHDFTQCVEHAGGCTAYSPHMDWYHGIEQMVELLLEEAKVKV